MALLALGGLLAPLIAPSASFAQTVGPDTIRGRNIDVSRAGATKTPRAEGDQALLEGWPLYRTERAQAAFNDAMATLRVTEGPPPAPQAFGGCRELQCNLTLPSVGGDGWLPAGRLWVSPTEYLLIVHSPRLAEGQSYRRRAYRDMRYFVFHEFANSTHNTDVYDTISSHSGSVFVPLYMSKQWTDAKGRSYVIVVQVAPYDVVSIHASNKGSLGPGMEVAKNLYEALDPLQALAGILIATMLKTAAPHLEVVNHRDAEGLPMLNAYRRRLALLRETPGAPVVSLPFVRADASRMATASGRLQDLVAGRNVSPHIPVAERGVVPRGYHEPAEPAASVRSAALAGDPVPQLIGPIRPAIRPARLDPTLVAPLRPTAKPDTGAPVEDGGR